MKKLVIAIVALSMSIVAGPVAQAATAKVTFTQSNGAPLASQTLENLNPAGDVITLTIGNFPAGKGMYVFQAVQGEAGKHPTVYNKASQQLVIADGTGTFKPTDLIKVPVVGDYSWGADCAHQVCGIQVELAYPNLDDHSEDQFFPMTFAATSTAPKGDTSTATTSSVTVTASINGLQLEQNKASVPLAYRTPLKVIATASDGSNPTLKFTPDPSGKTFCVVEGVNIKAVTGTGTCNLEVHAGSAVGYYPFYLAKGIQSAKQKVTTAKRGKPKSLTLKTNFGETISYKSTSKKICTLVDNTLIGLAAGKCTVTAAAPGTANFDQYNAQLVVTITNK